MFFGDLGGLARSLWSCQLKAVTTNRGKNVIVLKWIKVGVTLWCRSYNCRLTARMSKDGTFCVEFAWPLHFFVISPASANSVLLQ